VVGASEQTIVRVPKKTINGARQLRRTLSPPEVQLSSRLRERVPGKPVFRRQHPIGPYVLDSYCAKAILAVEIDGVSHDMGDRPERDEHRDAWLKKRGVTVIRIPAAELARDFDQASDAIVRAAMKML
jgi:very-short-patch-repair endonuclease